MVRRGVALLLPLGMAGCSQFRTELGQPLHTDERDFVTGKTSVQTVLHELGPPSDVSSLPDGFVFLYEYSKIEEFQIGFSVPLPIVRWLKFVQARNQLTHEAAVMTFDDRGVLRAIGDDLSKKDLGGGTALQLIVSVTSLTDTSAYRQPGEAHAWGASSLRRLPSTLNTDQSLRSGTRGLQFKAAHSYAGQHSLEMPEPPEKRPDKRTDVSEPF
jgi:hypothetical protein